MRDNVVKAVTDFLTAPIREGRVDFSLWDIIAFGLVLTAAILISREFGFSWRKMSFRGCGSAGVSP